MARYRDNAPIKNTCPDINQMQSNLESMARILEGFHTEDKWQEKEIIDSIYDLYQMSKSLENLRNQNQELRDWGNSECARVEELEKDLDYANQQLSELESDLKYANERISDLENQLEESTDLAA